MLTPLTAEDRDLILPWRNAPEVRRAMYSQHEITNEEHRAWFTKMQADSTREWFLYQDEGGDPQGVVYFDPIRPDHRTAVWGFYTRPSAPAGTGTRMLAEALDWAFSKGQLRKIIGETLETNPASQWLHQKLGFREEGRLRQEIEVRGDSVDLVRWGIFHSEWRESRPAVVKRVAQLNQLSNSVATPPNPS